MTHTKCLYCQEELTSRDIVIEMVVGKLSKNAYGGLSFSKDQAFAVQGYVHFACLFTAAENYRKEKKDPETQTKL